MGPVSVGEKNSELKLDNPGRVKISATVAAFLQQQPDTAVHPLDVRKTVWHQMPFWNIERARIPGTRKVYVELVVNGEVKDRQAILADGAPQAIAFEADIAQSSWVALRILPSSHTNPVFVIVNNKPIRASKKSAEWCLKAVQQCWSQKSPQISRLNEAKRRRHTTRPRRSTRSL